jgi:mRNA interferase MazF/mRNA interferase ChpB
MRGPHDALVLSATDYNFATGLVVASPITSKIGKLSGFEFPVCVGRVNGVAILSEARSLDDQTRRIRFEARIDPADLAKATRRVRMIFP